MTRSVGNMRFAKVNKKGQFVATENAGQQFNVEMTWKAYETPVHKYADRLDDLLGGIMTEEEIKEVQLFLEKMKDAAENLDEDGDDDALGFADGSGSEDDVTPVWTGTQTFTRESDNSSSQWKTY